MKLYRVFSLCMMGTFILVGLVFLFLPAGTFAFFNSLTRYDFMEKSSLQDPGFFLILASGYMYLVSLLAFLMFTYPENSFFPLLLANAKLASSALSLGLYVFHSRQLIMITNFIVDGLIGAAALYFFFAVKKRTP